MGDEVVELHEPFVQEPDVVAGQRDVARVAARPPAHVEPGARTIEVIGYDGASGGIEFTIPASYFHATATTAAGKHRITGTT